MSFAWESNPQYLAQVGHFLGGALVVFTVGVLFHDTYTLPAFGIGLVVAAVKEFLLDLLPPPYGEGDTLPNSAMDFAFYALGGTSGLGLTALAVARHCLAP